MFKHSVLLGSFVRPKERQMLLLRSVLFFIFGFRKFELKRSLLWILNFFSYGLGITICDNQIDSASNNLNFKVMWTPISVDKFVKLHLKKNPKENEKVLRVRIEAALEDFKNGVKCQCGKDIWIVGSASTPFGCFSCITGQDHPRGDYEIDSALEKRDNLGRRHIDEMDPRKIAGMFDDDGYEIRRDTIKMQPLCLTCEKNNSEDWEDDLSCNLQRFGHKKSETFECYGYQKLV